MMVDYFEISWSDAKSDAIAFQSWIFVAWWDDFFYY
jgi:hypothetical protein